MRQESDTSPKAAPKAGEEIAPAPRPTGGLRRGWTTGACATAAAKAAFEALLTGAFPDPVVITLPRGERPSFALASHKLGRDAQGRAMARAEVIKDAGDDPDVTHLACVGASVRRLEPGAGVRFKAGEGVGIVTRPGLPLPPGEPAINPVPRRMMQTAIEEVAAAHGVLPDAEITVTIANGAALAKQTWNPRLGIEGGLSILGTTGIVNPYSCAAWIASIHRGIDVIRAAGIAHAAACTGAVTEAAVKKRYGGLPDIAFIDMGDFAGGVLKYLRHHPLPALTLAGGFGKISKLANGSLDLHSGRSQVNLDFLAEGARMLGADAMLAARIKAANTAMEALDLARMGGVALGDWVATRARIVAVREAGDAADIEILIYDRTGNLAGHAGFERR